MAVRLALLIVPAAGVSGLVVLLNGLDASAGVAVATLGIVAVAAGGAFGWFADRLPEPPRAHRSQRLTPHHVD